MNLPVSFEHCLHYQYYLYLRESVALKYFFNKFTVRVTYTFFSTMKNSDPQSGSLGVFLLVINLLNIVSPFAHRRPHTEARNNQSQWDSTVDIHAPIETCPCNLAENKHHSLNIHTKKNHLLFTEILTWNSHSNISVSSNSLTVHL